MTGRDSEARLIPRAPCVASWCALAALIPVALAAWVYRPLLGGWFWADDLTNMVSIANEGPLPFLFRPFGGHNLLVRNLVFVASYWSFGLDARPWFWTVYLTHLLNVWLLFRIVRTVTASVTLACFGAALWGASPVVAGALEWYSVFGHVLVATVLLVVLDRLTILGRDGAALPARTAFLWYALLLLSTLCFGVGVGIVCAFPVALFVVLPAAWSARRVRVAYLALPIVTLALYAGFPGIYELVWGALPQGQVPLSQLARSLPQAVRDVGDLVAFAATELPRGFLAAGRKRYPDRFSPWVLAVVCAGVVTLLWRGDAAARHAALGLAVLTAGGYVVIALGQVRMTLAGVVPATQLRYHYAASLPLVVLLCLALREVGEIGWLRRIPQVALLTGALGIFIWTYARADWGVDQHANARMAARRALDSIVAEVRAAPPDALVHLENGTASYFLLGPVMRPPDLPGRAGLLVIAQPGDVVEGRTVRFVERDAPILRHYQQRPDTRLGRLLVGPDAVPAAPAR